MLNNRYKKAFLLVLVVFVGLFLVNGCDLLKPTYSLFVGISGLGTVDPPMGIHWYESGTVDNLLATPVAGYEFREWDGDVASKTSARTTILMDKNQSVTARFRQIR